MKKLLILTAGIALMTSCSSTETLYSWYNSEDASYQYTKRLTEDKLKEAMLQYEKVLKNQKGTRKVVPPGANAEYGYLLYKSGKKTEGIALMKEEMRLYPESEKFISRIVKQLEK